MGLKLKKTLLSADDDAAIAGLNPGGYTFNHIPRTGKHGGGVAFLFRSYHLNVKVHPGCEKIKYFEMIEMDVMKNSSTVHLAVSTDPPGTSAPFRCFLDEER